ncbi:hypothetical protein FISHEDRAFT_62825 [Fistulina hepatica ATCC 64428]|uniref:Uncharacterized protein n=1 Tax=Fistulina hepatica ATCC 64428 TaxID=1128425 RepID=A0A0D7A2T1_9AGAR|nr:hypothetical protein FISHEDRAFT_62825 [Fistulina hepatica ATCC 64428]
MYCTKKFSPQASKTPHSIGSFGSEFNQNAAKAYRDGRYGELKGEAREKLRQQWMTDLRLLNCKSPQEIVQDAKNVLTQAQGMKWLLNMISVMKQSVPPENLKNAWVTECARLLKCVRQVANGVELPEAGTSASIPMSAMPGHEDQTEVAIRKNPANTSRDLEVKHLREVLSPHFIELCGADAICDGRTKASGFVWHKLCDYMVKNDKIIINWPGSPPTPAKSLWDMDIDTIRKLLRQCDKRKAEWPTIEDMSTGISNDYRRASNAMKTWAAKKKNPAPRSNTDGSLRSLLLASREP